MSVRIIEGDCTSSMLGLIAEGVRVQTIITSPPYYGLRDYGVDGQIGLEPSPREFIDRLVGVFDVAWDLLADHGVLWLNMGDSYATGTNMPSRPSSGVDTGVWMQGVGVAGRRRVKGEGFRPKEMMGMPWRLAFALQDAGWFMRQDIIWHKPNPMPETLTDRCTKAHEYLFLFSKSCKPIIWRDRISGEWRDDVSLIERRETVPSPTDEEPDRTVPRWQGRDYFFNAEAIKEPASEKTNARVAKTPAGWAKGEGKHNAAAHQVAERHRKVRQGPKMLMGLAQGHVEGKAHRMAVVGYGDLVETRNKRSVWTVPSEPFPEAHFATFPTKLIEPCVLAGSRPGDIVFDPFGGSGTTGLVADAHQRHAILCELNPAYAAIARKRITNSAPLFAEVS